MTLLETFRRYHAIIAAALPSGDADRAIDFAPTRAVERPLLVYARLMQFKRQYESLSREKFGQVDESLRGESDALEAGLELARIDPVNMWSALALHVAGKIFIRDAWTDLASDAFGRLARGQAESGRFYPSVGSTPASPAFSSGSATQGHLPQGGNPTVPLERSPEASWFDELTTLHAAASYAVQAEDRHVARAVEKSSRFIMNEIEPDHATGQPWGLFAFIWNQATRGLADQLLHSVEMRRGELDAVSLILLQDALYCVELFLN